MDKMFEHKLKEAQNSPRTHPPSSSKQPDDLKLAQNRVDLVDRKRASEEQIKADTKRSRMVDLLRSDGKSDGPDQSKHGQLSNMGSQIDQNIAGRPRPHESDKLGSVLSSMTLKYSRRSSSYIPVPALQGRLRKSSPQPSAGDVLKYSQIKGLGRRWPAPLVFPKEGKKRTTVNFDDLERLDEGEFLNDNLISFYLRYLEVQAEKANAMTSRKVYVFNSFFFERLTDGKNGHKGINYAAVRKWTRDVDIFTYDFVVVPVNEAAHWYLAIICNLPELKRKLGGFEDELGQGEGPNGEEESPGVNKKDELFSSSPPRAPKDKDAEVEDATSKKEPQDVKEQETAASFAEMSLDANEDATKKNSHGLNVPVALSSDGVDQAMLDNQLQSPVDEVKQSQSRSAEHFNGFDKREVKSPRSRVVTPAKSKAGKRKSMPRTFDPYKPTILTFDSFGNARPAAVKVLKQYLHEEAKDKRGQMEFDEKELQGVTAKRIPEQNNFSDCGVFLLGYMEAFFANPRDFVDKVMRHELHLESDWAKLDASKIRNKIRGLLQDLEKQQREQRMRAKGVEKSSKPLGQEHADVAKVETKSRPTDAVGENRLARDNADDSVPAKMVPQTEHQARATTPRTRTAALQSAKEIGDISPAEGSKPDVEPVRKAAMEISPEAPRHSTPIPIEQPPQSFIVLDSQSQSFNANPAELLTSHNDTKSPLDSPELPSTIPDSQPPVTVSPVKDTADERRLLKDITPARSSPPSRSLAKSRPRHIESFSSPPPPPLPQRSRDIIAAYTRENDSGGSTAPEVQVLGTDPKVVIDIDD